MLTVEGGIWCGGNYAYNFNSGWSMLTDKNAHQYAQAGWDRTYNNPAFPRQFSQWTIPSSLCQPPYGQPVCTESNFTLMHADYGDAFTYTVSQGVYGDEAVWVGAYKLDTTSYSLGTYWTHPLGIQDLGEVGDIEDGMIGKPYPNTSHWDYLSAEVLGPSWQAFRPSSPANDNPSIWYLNSAHSCNYYGVQWCLDTWS